MVFIICLVVFCIRNKITRLLNNNDDLLWHLQYLAVWQIVFVNLLDQLKAPTVFKTIFLNV